MQYVIAQILLAPRRSEDAESWMNILIPVIIAAFWVLGSIVKSRQKQPAAKEKPPQPRSVPKPRAPGRAAPQQSDGPTQLRPLEAGASARPRPHVQQPRLRAPRQKSPAERRTAQELVPAKASTPEIGLPKYATLAPLPEQPGPSIEEIPQMDSKLLGDIKSTPTGQPQKAPTPEALVEPLVHLGDSEELRLAILHYEVFGKPLALRGFSEHLVAE